MFGDVPWRSEASTRKRGHSRVARRAAQASRAVGSSDAAWSHRPEEPAPDPWGSKGGSSAAYRRENLKQVVILDDLPKSRIDFPNGPSTVFRPISWASFSTVSARQLG